MRSWTLHPQLAADTVQLLDWPLSRLLLMNDQRFPWVIQVPRVGGLTELYQLDATDSMTCMRESNQLSAVLMGCFHGEKMNVAALGNKVPQLHIHHVVRTSRDAAWPQPVWCCGTPEPYDPSALNERVAALQQRLAPSPDRT